MEIRYASTPRDVNNFGSLTFFVVEGLPFSKA